MLCACYGATHGGGGLGYTGCTGEGVGWYQFRVLPAESSCSASTCSTPGGANISSTCAGRGRPKPSFCAVEASGAASLTDCKDWRANMSGDVHYLLDQVTDGLSQGAQGVLLGLGGNQDHSEKGPARHAHTHQWDIQCLSCIRQCRLPRKGLSGAMQVVGRQRQAGKMHWWKASTALTI